MAYTDRELKNATEVAYKDFEEEFSFLVGKGGNMRTIRKIHKGVLSHWQMYGRQNFLQSIPSPTFPRLRNILCDSLLCTIYFTRNIPIYNLYILIHLCIPLPTAFLQTELSHHAVPHYSTYDRHENK